MHFDDMTNKHGHASNNEAQLRSISFLYTIICPNHDYLLEPVPYLCAPSKDNTNDTLYRVFTACLNTTRQDGVCDYEDALVREATCMRGISTPASAPQHKSSKSLWEVSHEKKNTAKQRPCSIPLFQSPFHLSPNLVTFFATKQFSCSAFFGVVKRLC